MIAKVWSAVHDKKGTVLGVDDENVFLVTVEGRAARSEIASIAQQLSQGANPREITSAKSVVIPLAQVEHLEFRPGGCMVEIYHRPGELSDIDLLYFIPQSGRACAEIAREIAAASRRPVDESQRDVGIFSAVASPSVATVVALFIAGVVYLTASDLEAGKEVTASGRRAGLKQLIIDMASFLGVQGTLIIGGIALVICLAWMVKNIVKRPKVMQLRLAKTAAMA